MAPKKGELRVRKGTRLFGPMRREDLVALLESKRLSGEDEVSVADGPWMRVAAFLQSPPAAAPSPAGGALPQASGRPARDLPAAASPGGDNDLVVIHNQRRYRRLTRQNAADLLAQSRLNAADLCSAGGGPWVSLGDFLAPPQPAAARPPLPAARRSAPAAAPPLDILEEVEEPPVAVPLESGDARLDTLEIISDSPRSPAPDASRRGAPPMAGPWHVHVRGVVSTNLHESQLESLLITGEINRETPIRHATWLEHQWAPLGSIPELAGLGQVEEVEEVDLFPEDL